MGADIGAGAAIDRSEELYAALAGSPSIDPSVGSTASFQPIVTAVSGRERRFPELDCLRGLLSTAVLATAERRAERLATGADRVLVASGAIDDETYARRLGKALGVAFEPLDDTPRAQCPLEDDRLIAAVKTGMLRLTTDEGTILVIALHDLSARKLVGLVAETPQIAARLRLTSAEHINRFVMRGASAQIAAQASDQLKRDRPMLSAASAYRLGSVASLTSVVMMALAGFALAPSMMAHAFEIGLATMFVAWLGLRLIGAFLPRPIAAAVDNDVPDESLPVYSVICALYREASSVDALLSALERLDYPGIMAQTPQAV
jgi:hypothetical protein